MVPQRLAEVSADEAESLLVVSHAVSELPALVGSAAFGWFDLLLCRHLRVPQFKRTGEY